MNAPDVAFQVARQFHALRRRYLTVRLATALLIAVAVLMGAWIVAAVVDYRWERALSHRTAGLFIVVTSVVGWLLWRLTHDIHSIRGRRFAGVLERAYSEFGQRIRTVLDTTDGRATGPPEMLGALGHQTLGRWELCAPGRIVPMRKLIATGIAALLGLVVSIVMLGLGGEWRTAMLRSIGWDTPYTQLKVTPGDAKILEGNAVVVAVELIGRTDRDVVLRYREVHPEASKEGSSDWIESELVGGKSEEQRSLRKAKLGKAIWPIEYQFLCRQQTTPVYRIDIQPLIKTKRIDIQVVAPEYTGLQPRTFPTANISVLERSTVHATIELNHPLGEASLLVGPKRSQMKPVTLTPGEDRSVWSFDLPAERTVRWIFSGSGEDGTPMEPVNGRMGVRRDGAPSIRWREPADAIKVHTLAEVPLTAQIGDDYGVAESGIAFQLGGEEEFVLIDWAPDEDAASDPSQAKTRLELSEILPLESFALSERDYIAYYAYAIDNRPWGQQRVESEVRYIDIRPLRQFYQEIDPPAGNGGGGRVIVQLGEIIRRQRFVINRTRKLLRGNESTDSQLQTIDRLFKTESELADLTRFLAEFFISRGNDDVEALSQAESSMLQAADSMAAGSLDLSMAQQQDSLRSLAEARRTLEIALLKRMTAAQQRALRKLATQMRQKLRRDRPITEQAIADSIRKIAMEERRLAIVAQKAATATPSEQANPQAGGSNSAMASETAEQDEPAEQDETDEELEKTKADEDSETKQDSLGETLYQQQTELLERLEAISTELTDRLSQSPLLASRMEQTQADMDALASQMTDGQMKQIASQASVLSERLDEIGLQLAASFL